MRASEFVKEAKKRVGKTGHGLFEKYKVRTDWCMMLVYDLMHDTAGITEFPKTFSCSGFTKTDFAQLRINHDFQTAEPGDIITFEINGNRADGADHVGIVLENDGSKIKLLEGNTNGSGSPWYETSTANIFEYSYNASCFDYIVDMSGFFTGEVVTHPPDTDTKTDTEPIASTFQPKERRVLRKGSKGEFVKSLQQLLWMKGYAVGADDGDFGSKTEKSVMDFQADHKLEVDGIVGIQTFEELIGK